MTCDVCAHLGLPCLLHADRYADRRDNDGHDVSWETWGPRCGACARSMRRWGEGWGCNGCGLAVDEYGQEIRL